MIEILDNLFGQKEGKKDEEVKTDAENTVIESASKSENLEIDDSDSVPVRIDDIELNVSKDIAEELEMNGEVHPKDVEVEIFISKLQSILDREQSLDFSVVSLKKEINNLIKEYING